MQPLLSAARSVCWCTVLLEDEFAGQQVITIIDEIWKQLASVIHTINLFDKMLLFAKPCVVKMTY